MSSRVSPALRAVALAALAALCGTGPAQATELVGFASLPADTFSPGPTAGEFVSSANGRTLPLVNQQAVQGFSAVLPGPRPGTFRVMPDNGFGTQANSPDAVLRRLQALHPERTGPWRIEMPLAPDRPVLVRYYNPPETAGRGFAPLMLNPIDFADLYRRHVMAQQAQGAVAAYLDEETMLLSATSAGKHPREGFDFFPLTVDVEERSYAAGKIPGSFFRREGRPSTEAILVCRLIDRPLRPSFVDGLRNEVQIVVTVLSIAPGEFYDALAINAASLSTHSTGPETLSKRWTISRAASLTASLAKAPVTPRPIIAGVFGIARTMPTGPRCASIEAMVNTVTAPTSANTMR